MPVVQAHGGADRGRDTGPSDEEAAQRGDIRAEGWATPPEPFLPPLRQSNPVPSPAGDDPATMTSANPETGSAAPAQPGSDGGDGQGLPSITDEDRQWASRYLHIPLEELEDHLVQHLIASNL